MMGHPAIAVLTCVVAAYAIAAAIYPAIRRHSVMSGVAAACACVVVAACLFLIPPQQVVLRAVTAVLMVDLAFRLIDFTRHSWRGCVEPTGWGAYCRFLIPFPLFLVVFGQKDRRLPPERRSVADFSRLALGSAGVALGFVLLAKANAIAAVRASLVLDQVARLCIFALTVESLAQALCGLERLMGSDTRPIVDQVVRSRTPADFWRRFNTRVHRWLYLNVFIPSGGRRTPICGVWATFFVSAVLHEVGFAIATSRVTGNQLIFFLLQAPAVLVSPWLDRFARAWGVWGAIIAHCVTIVWIGSTSVFFFDDVGRVFTFFYPR